MNFEHANARSFGRSRVDAPIASWAPASDAPVVARERWGEERALPAAYEQRQQCQAAVEPAPARDAAVDGRTPVQIHLVAPSLVCWGLSRLIQTAGAHYILSGFSHSLAEALPRMETSQPDVTILDIDDGCTIAEISDLYVRRRAKILALTSVSDASFLTRVLESGARGIVHKRESPGTLLQAIDDVGEGRVFATQADAGRLFVAAARTAVQARPDARAGRIASLTVRERQTIAAVTSDSSAPVKVIAGRLCISEHTLRNHLTSIYSKLGVCGRLDLYAFASAHDLNRPQAGGR